MKVTIKTLAVAASVVAVGFAVAQRSTPQTRPNRPAETSLVGVNIFDTGMLLLDMFGSPVQLQPLATGGGGVAGGAPGAGGGGGARGGGASGGRGLPAVGVTNDTPLIGDPFSQNLNQFGTKTGQRPGQIGDGAPGGGDEGVSSRAGASPGGGGGAGGARVLYTRWVYDRPAAKYSFIVDKFNRVVQIEAIGVKDQSVVTSRGIGFGSTFADVLRAYNVPDAYEISGDSIVMRYLVRDHVAFRLSRLKEDDPHRVTGVVVAAGKQ